jgi:hypothetical protein
MIFMISDTYRFPVHRINQLTELLTSQWNDIHVIIWLIVRICMFIKDWKLIYSELFILKRKRMENWVFFDLSFYSDILSKIYKFVFLLQQRRISLESKDNVCLVVVKIICLNRTTNQRKPNSPFFSFLK